MTRRLRRAAGATLAVALVACGGGDDGNGPAPGPPPPGVSILLARTAGDGQRAVAGTTLLVPLTVRATELDGAPAAGITIAWRASSGAGTPDPATSITDAEGIARTTWRTDAAPGPTTVAARAEGEDAALSEDVTFGVTTVAPAPAALLASVPIPPSYGIHDTFVRDGLAFVSAWNTGIIIYDVGNGLRGGSPGRPVEVSRFVPPAGPGGLTGLIHNAWWFHNPVTGEKRYLFVGQEGPGTTGAASSGDIYVLDVSDLTRPSVVATYSRAGAGTHNFWMDEAGQVLYAAYYNAGVVAFDVSGTLSGDLAPRVLAQVAPGGTQTFTWSVQLAADGALYASDMESGLWKLAPAAGQLQTIGGGLNVPDRWTSDLWVHGGYAYTGTWGGVPRTPGAAGDQLKVWDVQGSSPVALGAVPFPGVVTISDVEVSRDGATLLVTTERGASQGLHLLSLANPAVPAPAGFAGVPNGLHTGTFAEIGGRRYVFAAKNPQDPALLVFDVGPTD